MINVTVVRRQDDQQILEFRLSGHAQFAQYGQDIVCAAVSAITFGSVNAISALLDIEIVHQIEEETGFLHCLVPEELEADMQEKIQLLLEAMLVSLQSVAAEYGNFMKINIIRR